MKVTTYAYLLIPIFFLLGCEGKVPNSSEIRDHESFQELNITPEKSISLKTQDFIDTVQFIPLETTKESEFSEVSQIECLPDRYIILDKSTSQILFFNKDGKFIAKISSDNSKLPVSYEKIVDFTVDRYKKKVYFSDLYSTNVFEFSLNGDFLNVSKKSNLDYAVRENHHIHDQRIRYLSYKAPADNQGAPYNLTVFKDDAILRTYLPFDTAVIDRNDVYGAKNYFFESGDVLFFTMPYSEEVYRFDKSGEISRAFHFTFPEQLRIPKDFTKSEQYKGQRKRFLKDNGDKIYLITNFYQLNNNLVFRLIGGKYSDLFFYNLSNQSLISLKRFVSDSTTNYLPIIGESILGIDNGKMLSSLPSKKFIGQINNRGKQGNGINSLPKDIRAIYERGNNQNPILLLTSLKSEISYENVF